MTHAAQICRDQSSRTAVVLEAMRVIRADVEHADPSIRDGYAGLLSTTDAAVTRSLGLMHNAALLLQGEQDLPALLSAAPCTLLTLLDAHTDGLLVGSLLDHWTVEMRRLAREYADYADQRGRNDATSARLAA